MAAARIAAAVRISSKAPANWLFSSRTSLPPRGRHYAPPDALLTKIQLDSTLTTICEIPLSRLRIQQFSTESKDSRFGEMFVFGR